MTLEELEKRQDELAVIWDELQAEFNALKKAQAEEAKPKPPHPRWKPEYKGKYYIVLYNGCSVETYWAGCTNDNDEYAIGNIFKTKAEAKFAAERMRVLAEMREWAGNWDDGVAIKYDGTNKMISTTFISPRQYTFGEMRFATKADAEGCIKAVGEDRIKKYYFMVPEES